MDSRLLLYLYVTTSVNPQLISVRLGKYGNGHVYICSAAGFCRPDIGAAAAAIMTDTGEVTKSGRALVLCFDGTSGEYDGDNTNIVKFFALLKKDDFNEQLCYYQPGIGTWFNPGVVSPVFLWGAKVLDQAFAWYLDAHVIEGYRFLMQNYRVGDKICIFGFSRGSYTARALAGALYKVGLLPRDNEQQVPFACKLYKREDKAGLQLCAGFKQTFCQDVKVEFMGVWDTVSSVGVIMGRTLPFTNSNKAIKVFRHALALDEAYFFSFLKTHRARFRPNNFRRPAPSEAAAVLDPEHGTPVLGSGTSDTRRLVSPKRSGIISRLFRRPLKIFLDAAEEQGADTDVLEVWFSGCHSDVGGGAVADAETRSLANISLRWMVREVQQARCGIQFEEAALERAQIPHLMFADTLLDVVLEDTALDVKDALQPIHDELKKNVLWWLLEIIPLSYSWQDKDGVWHREFGFNFGKGRKIRDPNPCFHPTVKQRMEDPKLKYKPKAVWTAGTEKYTH
ncbi:hypothetical protein D9615_006665 [Tricholomella constricta]|uniref:T6SS Phospholipase effector Tle1-like catalytic domain-containing protein n=1 Tax=Tricholomella constricta TaxID=117010 RepID=A0A8H5M222_9AGAR|nr:hypothetical protein D9615_006665 [Tricholomella constricta]